MTSAEKETTLKELEANLWETADSLRNESSLTSQMHYMPQFAGAEFAARASEELQGARPVNALFNWQQKLWPKATVIACKDWRDRSHRGQRSNAVWIELHGA